MPATQGTKPYFVVVSLLFVLLTAGLFAAKSKSMLAKPQTSVAQDLSKSGASPATPNLSAASQPAAPTLQATETNAATTSLAKTESAPSTPLQVPAQTAEMPNEVRTYLAHLSRIEAQRQSMARQQASNLTAMMGAMQAAGASNPGEGDPLEQARNVNSNARQMEDAWTQLGSQFDAVNPPQECAALAASYRQLLGETATMIEQIVSVVGGMSDPQSALNSLKGMQGSSSKIDLLAQGAEQQLVQLYARYQSIPTFHIAQDLGK